VISDYKDNMKWDNIYKGLCFSCLILGFSLGLFFFYHLGNVLDNVTTLEDNIEGIRKENPFHNGSIKNFESIFGNFEINNIMNIFLPLKVKSVN